MTVEPSGMVVKFPSRIILEQVPAHHLIPIALPAMGNEEEGPAYEVFFFSFFQER